VTTTWLLCWLILLLGMSGWWCDCCEAIEPHPCGYCVDGEGPPVLPLTLSGIGNGACDCAFLVVTWMLPPAIGFSGAPVTCVWETRGDFVCGESAGSYYIYAAAGVIDGTNRGWSVTVQVAAGRATQTTVYIWNSGSSSPMDCWAAQTLTRGPMSTGGSPPYPCANWDTSGCAVN